MSSTGDSNRPFGDSDNDNDDTPTYNRPWPYVSPFQQGRFERKFLAAGDTINFDSLPKLQFWASWFGVSDVFRVLSVLRRVESHSTIAQRPLTGTEAHAIGEHTSRAVRYFAWTQPVSYAIALAITASKRGTFSFPFYRPKMKAFDPFSFPTKRFRFLKGAHAARMWHVVRFAAYLPFAWIPTTFIFSSISNNSFAAHARRDSRLTSLIQESRQIFQQQLRRRAGVPSPAGTVPPKNPQQTGDGAYGDGPTPQNYGGADYAAQSSSDFERSSAAPVASRATQPTWASSTSTRPAPHKAQETALPDSTSRHGGDDSSLFDDDDDASPVAPSARSQGVGQGQASLPRSSWDRIRQQAKSGSPNWERGDSSGQEQGWAQLRQDKTQRSRDYTPKTDSYSYSTEDEEKERRDYEKEQAQKEFDALLEAERRGEGGSGSSRGWRK